jgi:hypothetical protein
VSNNSQGAHGKFLFLNNGLSFLEDRMKLNVLEDRIDRIKLNLNVLEDRMKLNLNVLKNRMKLKVLEDRIKLFKLSNK